MGCLFAIFAGAFPRLGTLFIWIVRPELFSAAFSSWFWPALGIVFLPFTTLMYVLVWSPTGLTGWDWFWVILAAFLDITQSASTAYSNRDQIPGYSAA